MGRCPWISRAPRFSLSLDNPPLWRACAITSEGKIPALALASMSNSGTLPWMGRRATGKDDSGAKGIVRKGKLERVVDGRVASDIVDGGRRALQELCQGHTFEAIETLVSILKNPNEKSAARVMAARFIVEQAHGRASSTKERPTQQALTINVVRFSDAVARDLEAEALKTVREMAPKITDRTLDDLEGYS